MKNGTSQPLRLLSVLLLACAARSFCVPSLRRVGPGRSRLPADTSLSMAAPRGMGMAPKKNRTSKSKRGMAARRSKPASFDVGASVGRLEKKYETLLQNFAKQVAQEEMTADTESIWDEPIVGTEQYRRSIPVQASEFVVAARALNTKAAVADWIPIAQICLARRSDLHLDDDDNTATLAAVSAYCRELHHVATLAAPVFNTIPRNDIQYSIESVDEFHKHVYSILLENDTQGESNDRMTKAEARAHLGLDDTAVDMAQIKSAYRKLAFQLHSDRFQGNEQECAQAAQRFRLVQNAYETLSSGIRQQGTSWYASLGGKSRTGFIGPVALQNIEQARNKLTDLGIDSAVVGLDRDLVQSFVARNLRSG